MCTRVWILKHLNRSRGTHNSLTEGRSMHPVQTLSLLNWRWRYSYTYIVTQFSPFYSWVQAFCYFQTFPESAYFSWIYDIFMINFNFKCFSFYTEEYTITQTLHIQKYCIYKLLGICCCFTWTMQISRRKHSTYILNFGPYEGLERKTCIYFVRQSSNQC